jgi:hypothetical protein
LFNFWAFYGTGLMRFHAEMVFSGSPHGGLRLANPNVAKAGG